MEGNYADILRMARDRLRDEWQQRLGSDPSFHHSVCDHALVSPALEKLVRSANAHF